MDATEINALSRTGAWRLEDTGDGIFQLVLDLPGEKVNKLTSAVLADLEAMLDSLAREPWPRALIVAGGKRDSGTFIAGADIQEILAVSDPAEAEAKARRGQEILGKLAAIPAVTIAAIDGNCLGGGTELALACDLRVASHSPKTKIGLPEVQLGIIPGFGGTQRLPRLVGIQAALPVILEGKPVGADKALRLGLVDRVAYPDLLLREARALANVALLSGGKQYRPRRRRAGFWRRLLEGTTPGRLLIRSLATRAIRRTTGGHYPAPLAALEAVIRGASRSLRAGLELEASLVGPLIVSPISKNLIRLFLSSEDARRGKRGARVAEAAPPGAAPAPAENRAACGGQGLAGVLGAGVMGGGIVALFVQRGFRVRWKDISPAAIQTGFARVNELFGAQVKRRRMTRREAANRMAAITTTLDDSGFERASVVLEAVVEVLEVKKKVLRAIEERVSPDCLLASNTSALSITELQGAAARPERVVGFHFFNPVHRMPLVEVIRGKATSEATVERAEALARELGKIPVRVEDSPGFLVNRLLAPYLNEAARLFEDGYCPEAVDRALRAFGMPMGPFELLDEVGLDVAARVARVLEAAFGSRLEPPAVMGRLVEEAKLLGKKGGAGFYLHAAGAGKKRPRPNPAALRLGGAAGKAFLADDASLWIERLIYPLINEAARALEAGIVASPATVDLAMVMGTGFAPFRGGPLRHADSLGAAAIVAALERWGSERHAPSELLLRLAREKSGFYDLERQRQAVLSG